jgi:hypothetical protein
MTDAWVAVSHFEEYDVESRTVAAFSTEERARSFVAARFAAIEVARSIVKPYAELTGRRVDEVIEAVCRDWTWWLGGLSEEQIEKVRRTVRSGDPGYMGDRYTTADELGERQESGGRWHTFKISSVQEVFRLKDLAIFLNKLN